MEKYRKIFVDRIKFSGNNLTDRQTDRQTGFITYFRVFGVICILLCHLVQECSIAYVQMLAQFFNVGVDIFIIISGFCFGLQGKIVEWKKWYKKRIKRIYIPYEIFLIVLAFVYLIVGRTLNFKNWLSCILGVQGANVGVLGADHTWFITALLLCYLITPVLSEFDFEKKSVTYITIGILWIVPFVLSFMPMRVFHTIGVLICYYSIAYIWGRKYQNGYRIHYRYLWHYILGIIILFMIRVSGKIFMDGSRMYDCNIVSYTQVLIAFCILAIFSILLSRVKVTDGIKWLGSISYEIYLYHYMFIVGPSSFFKVINSWLLASILSVAFAVVMAYIMNRAVRKIDIKINEIRVR